MTTIFAPLSLAERGLGYHLQRQQLLISNVANAQTPGFKPLELRFRALLDAASSMDRSHPRHLAQLGDTHLGASRQNEVYEDAVISPAPDGNSVSMERQMAKLAANSLRYRATSELINRRLALLRYAASDGRR